jgi:hypothetical protein
MVVNQFNVINGNATMTALLIVNENNCNQPGILGVSRISQYIGCQVVMCDRDDEFFDRFERSHISIIHPILYRN